MNIFIIAHGGVQIGMGHVMRSLALADEFFLCGHTIIFCSRYDGGKQEIRKHGFALTDLSSEDFLKSKSFYYGGEEELQQEIDCVSSYSKKVPVDLLVIDSYNISAWYFNELQKVSKCVMYIDDLNLFSYPVNIIVNGTASAMEMGYEKQKHADLLLLGLSYNMLRKEFRNIIRNKYNGKIRDLLISTGGSDPHHMTEWFLAALVQMRYFKDINFHVVIGSSFCKPEILKEKFQAYENILFYDQPSNISQIMNICDFAVVSGGSTIYELAACGVSSAAFCYAENQIPQIKTLTKEQCTVDLGYYLDLKEDDFINQIEDLFVSSERCREMTVKFKNLVDALGTKRIVKEVEKYIEEQYVKRKCNFYRF